MKGSFEFDLPLVKAYQTDKGAMRVVGLASDTLPDQQNEFMSDKALTGMAKQLKNGLALLDNHRSTFPFGRTVDGSIHEDGQSRQLLVEFELDPKYPQSLDLFNEVQARKSDKQLSIGGMLDQTDPKAVEWDRRPDGSVLRKINAVTLDHIATTRSGRAANQRTGFMSAIVKSLDEDDSVEKGAVPYQKTPMAKPESPWSFTAEEGNALLGGADGDNWDRYKAAHAWFDPSNPKTRGAYKLPHHKLVGGTLETFFRGVVAAAGALLGARGGTNIPKADVSAVAGHLARHYKDFDKDPPETLKKCSDGDVSGFQKLTYNEFLTEHKAVGYDVAELFTAKDWEDINMEKDNKPAETPAASDTSPAAVVEAPAEAKTPELAKSNDDVVEGLSLLSRVGRFLRKSVTTTEDVDKGVNLVITPPAPETPTALGTAPETAEKAKATKCPKCGGEVVDDKCSVCDKAKEAVPADETEKGKNPFPPKKKCPKCEGPMEPDGDEAKCAKCDKSTKKDETPAAVIETPAAPVAPTVTLTKGELDALIAKAIAAAVEPLKTEIATLKTSTEKSVADLAVADATMAKSVTDLTATVEKQKSDVDTAVETVSKEHHTRLETLEKASGVSQAIQPDTTDDVLAPTTSVEKDIEDNPNHVFKGILGGALRQFRSKRM
jgi:phage head maturation protease